MKRIFISIIILINSVSLFSQEKYSLTAKVGSGIPISTPGITPLTVDALVHYQPASHWAFGLGSGWALYDNVSIIPLYVNVKYTINPQATYQMFADCSIGYGFAVGRGKNGGFLTDPEFGVQRKLWNKTFSIAVGYGYQELERLKSNSDNYVSSQFVEELSLHSVSIKLGIIF